MPPAFVSASEPATGRLVRRSGGKIVGGVAGGIADHIGVDVFKVRVAFVLLAALGGAGIVIYGLLWVSVPAGSDVGPPSPLERRRATGLVILGVGASFAASWAFSGTAASVLVPIVVIALGAALVWREFDDGAGRSEVGLSPHSTIWTWSRVIGGVALVIAGLTVMLVAQVDFAALGPSLLAMLATLAGVGLLTVPLWLRLMRALNAERAARIRNDEREEIASHLHDSVLQTLALIQRQADSPQEVQRLARRQERELREWLFADPQEAHASLVGALRAVAGEVEDQYGVQISPVAVGDVVPGDAAGQLPKEQFTALLGAVREALVNAAKHAQVREVDLFSEAEPSQVSVYVRDRGTGFDLDDVPEDRQGLARSIRMRLERRGGEVSIRSTIGWGTEVRMVVPLSEAQEAQAG
ncbi:MAG: PspC domain-containing protein [Nocardiaceae bacterium]|nr:PspC domain-containing protein [Nocardiaceae bacterium]